MRVFTPPINWHDRGRVASVDFQPVCYPLTTPERVRLASCGDDRHVVIWDVRFDEEGKIKHTPLSDLSRHQNAINMVRWSPDGKLLASSDTDSVIFLWQYQDKESAPDIFGESGGGFGGPDDAGGESFKPAENWSVYKILRGHLSDVLSIDFSPCGHYLASCSTDNSVIVFDVAKGTKLKMLSEHKGWVQGVAWDPLGEWVASVSSDRILRLFNASKSYKPAFKTYKCKLSVAALGLDAKKDNKTSSKKGDSAKSEDADNKADDADDKPADADDKSEDAGAKSEGADAKPADAGAKKPAEPALPAATERMVRMFHDDTFNSFYRRLDFSPDGELLVVPSGVLDVEGEAAVQHCTHVFTRNNYAKPVLFLPNREISIAVRFSPVLYKLRDIPLADAKDKAGADSSKPWQRTRTMFALPYRMVYAVATQNTVVLYDTQQAEPFARVSKIHYIGMTDLTWSADGNLLTASAADGFCSVVTFAEGELGKVYKEEEEEEKENKEEEKMETEA